MKLRWGLERVMALDVGNRRIGVALSDPTRLLARSLKIINRRRDESELAEIAALIREHEVGEIVIGYPRHLSGDVGEQALLVEAYTEKLRGYLREQGLDTPISFWDERYSSVIAEERLQERGRRLRDKRGYIDDVAAAVILQEYLDAHRPPATLPEAPPDENGLS